MKRSKLNNTNQILLPGLNKQVVFLKNKLNLEDSSILIAGSGSASITNHITSNNTINIIVEDYESLISTRLELPDDRNVEIKLMDFERTDFPSEQLDLIYAQGSVSNFRRNKIIKEFRRICKPKGNLCIGELVALDRNIPNFVSELFDSAGLNPLFINDIIKYFSERNLKIIDSIDLSYTLKEYYEVSSKLLKENINKLDSREKAYYKKLYNRISHESNAYLKLGADKYIGFFSVLIQNN